LIRHLGSKVSSVRLRSLGAALARHRTRVRETPRAPNIQSAGHIARCFALEEKFTSLPSEAVGRLFYDVPLGFSLSFVRLPRDFPGEKGNRRAHCTPHPGHIRSTNFGVRVPEAAGRK
jgi:hypothetical protein